jgi:hypothetical protein
MAFDPSGGTQAIRIPFSPPVGVGEGSVVKFDVDGAACFAEVQSCRQERRHGAWNLYLYVRPIPTAMVALGWGELSDFREVEVIA